MLRRGPRRTHLHAVDVASGEARDLTPGDADVPPFSVGGPDDYDVSPDGKEVAYARKDPATEALSTDAELYVVPVAGGHGEHWFGMSQWGPLATTVADVGPASGGATLPADLVDAFERLRRTADGGSSQATTAAMANLAEAIQGLVQHMRSEQQMIREWADEQSKLNRDLRRFMEQVTRETVER